MVENNKKTLYRKVSFIIAIIGIMVGLFTIYISYTNSEKEKRLAIERENELRRQLEIENNKKKAIKLLNEGAAFARTGQFNKAIEKYLMAINADSTNASIYNVLGYVYLRRGNITEAVKNLEKSIELDPTDPWNYYNCSLAYWAANNRDLAIECIDKLLKIDPEFREIILNDVQFNKYKSSERFRKLLDIE